VILAVSIGNTNVHAAIGQTEPVCQTAAYSNELPTSEKFVCFIEEYFGEEIWGRLEGSIVSSVVPAMTPAITQAIRDKTGSSPKRIGTDSPGGLSLSRYQDTPGEDRVVCCVGALQIHAAPLILIDFGTAPTVNVINEHNEFIGGAILAGPQIGLEVLARKTAQLPQIENIGLDAHIPVIADSTKENLMSGAILGAAFAVEGYVHRIKAQLGQGTPVIVTGGHAPIILPYCGFERIHQPNLLLNGLFALCGK